MPNYEYTCQNCKANIELVQSIEKHPVPSECPFCSMQHTMVRVFNQPGESAEIEEETKEER